MNARYGLVFGSARFTALRSIWAPEYDAVRIQLSREVEHPVLAEVGGNIGNRIGNSVDEPFVLRRPNTGTWLLTLGQATEDA